MSETQEYKQTRYQKFVKECEAAGLEVEHYNGRMYFKGPAVRCDDIQEVIRATTVDCQTDNMGLGWIVYPK